jgi:maltooligosyltrehalose trehalohydrolase
VTEGRRQFLAQFPSLATWTELLADPADESTFRRCVLDHEERTQHEDAWCLHRDLLELRRNDPALRLQGNEGFDGAILSSEAFAMRFFAPREQDRLVVVNLGCDLDFESAPEPLLAPVEGHGWELLWSSEDHRYGGTGTSAIENETGFHFAGQCTLVLRPVPDGDEPARR